MNIEQNQKNIDPVLNEIIADETIVDIENNLVSIEKDNTENKEKRKNSLSKVIVILIIFFGLLYCVSDVTLILYLGFWFVIIYIPACIFSSVTSILGKTKDGKKKDKVSPIIVPLMVALLLAFCIYNVVTFVPDFFDYIY